MNILSEKSQHETMTSYSCDTVNKIKDEYCSSRLGITLKKKKNEETLHVTHKEDYLPTGFRCQKSVSFVVLILVRFTTFVE